MNSNKYSCALSGIRAKEDDIIDGEFPEGWIEIAISRKYINPKFEAIQFTKQGLIAQYLQGIPEDQRESQIMAISLQVEAQFAALEEQTEKWSEDRQILYIANPDENKALMNEYNKFRKSLGLRPEVRLDEDIPVVEENNEPKIIEEKKEEIKEEIKEEVKEESG